MKVRTLLLILISLVPLLLQAQKHKITVTYSTGIFRVKMFTPDWKKIRELNFDVRNYGVPTADSYHSKGAAASVRLNQNKDKLFIMLYDEKIASDPASSIPATAVYEFDLTTKKLEKIAAINSDYYIIWHYFEQQQKLIFYDRVLGWFRELNMADGSQKNLFRFQSSNSHSQLIPDSNGFTFIYAQRDSIFKTTYSLKGHISTSFIFAYKDFSGYMKDKLLLYLHPEKGELSMMICPEKRYTKNIPKIDLRSLWKDEQHFYVTESNALCIYDFKLALSKSYFIDRPYLYEKLPEGLLISYYENGSKQFGFIDAELKELIPLKDVHDDLLELVADLAE